MKKIMVMCLLICCLFATVSCGKKNTDATESRVELSKLQEDMLAADTTLPEMKICTSKDKDAELNFTALSDMDYDLVDEFFYAYAEDGGAQEIAVVKMKDKSDVADMMSSLNQHIETKKGRLQEYNPDQVDMVENAVLTREGAYVALVISEKNGLVQNVFKSAF